MRKEDNPTQGRWTWLIYLAAALSIAGCDSSSTGGSGNGNLSVLLEAEETIVDGLQNGDEEENIRDGFNVSFSRYVVAIGMVAMSQLDEANPQSDPFVFVADFKSLPTTASELTMFEGIPTGQYTSFGFETPAPDQSASNFNDVPEAEYNAMIGNDWSYIIEGTITRVSDEATKDFLIQADVPTVYSDCAVDGMEPGVSVSSNSSVDITLHGDHLFFNGFPDEEASVQRLAQWLWDIEDSNGNDVLDKPDFQAATNVETLFPQPTYTLTGGPISPIDNAWDFVRAQLGTQGHIFGEGECLWSPL